MRWKVGPATALAMVGLVAAACGSKAASPTSATTSTSAPSNPLTTLASTRANLAPAQKAQVQSILLGAVNHYASVFATGESLNHKASTDPNSPPSQFPAWRQSSGVEQDVSTFQTAFSKADTFYNASDEPTALSDWRDDTSQAQTDISSWVQTAVSWQIGQASDHQLAAAASAVQADLAKARVDVTQVVAQS